MLALWIALVAALVYMGISMLVGDAFIFSRYSMYSKITTRQEGAVLYVKAGEQFVPMDALDAVHGLDLGTLGMQGVPCSQQWLVYETIRWFEQVRKDVPQATPVEVGWRWLRVMPDGGVVERLEPKTSGTGRLRR